MTIHNLFVGLRPEAPNTDSFYRQCYITDLWKDALHGTPTYGVLNKEGRKEYRDYWTSKLKIELQHVCTECVIFVGKQPANVGRPLLKDRVPHWKMPFPTKKKEFEDALKKLEKRIQDGKI